MLATKTSNNRSIQYKGAYKKKRIIEETLNTIGCRTKKSQCKNMKHNEA